MTTYNRGQYIEEAIESVQRSLYVHWELIITDDCSTDGTSELVQKYLNDKRIKYFKNDKNLGQFANRNKAASLANGKYIKYLDSDDVIYDFGLNLLVEGLELFPDAAIAIASQDTHPTEFRYPQLISSKDAYLTYFFKDALLTIGPSGTMFRKEAFDLVGGYSGIHATADTELMLKLAALYDVVRVQPSFFFYRIHGAQVLSQSEKIETYAIEAYNNGIQALSNSNCPLTDVDKQKARNVLRKKILKVGGYQIIKKGRLNLGYNIIKHVWKK